MANQLHRRFTKEEVKGILNKYEQGRLDLKTATTLLRIGRSRFFDLLASLRANQEGFTIEYHRAGRNQIDQTVEQCIERELLKEKKLVDDPALPITTYNYSAVRDAVFQELGRTATVPTIIKRAQLLGYWKEKPPKKVHDREVLTDYPGELLQHDTSFHLWSPFADKKWYLIDTIDDFSRLILEWTLIERETSWAHIGAFQSVVLRYGIPLKYYVDSHSIFRFVRERDSIYQTVVLKTDEADTQWKQVLKDLQVEPIYALSPQAKGKVERPFRWMQDRVVREAAKKNLNTLNSVRDVLAHEVDRYNYHTIHSTTKEVPIMRFKRMQEQGKSVFRKFTVPKPLLIADDIFCLREKRMVNAYRKITFDRHELWVPHVPPRHEVELRMVPDQAKGILKVRIWFKERMVREVTLLAKDVRSVQF